MKSFEVAKNLSPMMSVSIMKVKTFISVDLKLTKLNGNY